MSEIIEVKVPDIGDFADVPVIEVFVKAGDSLKEEDAIATLESDKATMDVPSPVSGVVKEIMVQMGDRVSEGSLLLLLESNDMGGAKPSLAVGTAAGDAVTEVAPAEITSQQRQASVANPPSTISSEVPDMAIKHPAEVLSMSSNTHASPSVRAFARELGVVDLSQVKASGPKGRILKEDVKFFIKGALSGGATHGGTGSGSGLDILPWPQVDFGKFGEVETQPISRIGKISAQNLARNWVMIPAVTYYEEADITDLEAFRLQLNKENEKAGVKLTMLSFLVKAVVKALHKYPAFNSSLESDNLVLKKYYHIGFAADTPNGLVVPVIKNADQKSSIEIAVEASSLAKTAREGKLKPTDMQGACFTISSLGGIGGTSFSPIVNAPEVAILGANKSSMQPVWNGQEFLPRLILPFSLTADHRVIDGALATRFNVYIAQLLNDMRRMIV